MWITTPILATLLSCCYILFLFLAALRKTPMVILAPSSGFAARWALGHAPCVRLPPVPLGGKSQNSSSQCCKLRDAPYDRAKLAALYIFQFLAGFINCLLLNLSPSES